MNPRSWRSTRWKQILKFWTRLTLLLGRKRFFLCPHFVTNIFLHFFGSLFGFFCYIYLESLYSQWVFNLGDEHFNQKLDTWSLCMHGLIWFSYAVKQMALSIHRAFCRGRIPQFLLRNIGSNNTGYMMSLYIQSNIILISDQTNCFVAGGLPQLVFQNIGYMDTQYDNCLFIHVMKWTKSILHKPYKMIDLDH